jgi:hypothetical protein
LSSLTLEEHLGKFEPHSSSSKGPVRRHEVLDVAYLSDYIGAIAEVLVRGLNGS